MPAASDKDCKINNTLTDHNGEPVKYINNTAAERKHSIYNWDAAE